MLMLIYNHSCFTKASEAIWKWVWEEGQTYPKSLQDKKEKEKLFSTIFKILIRDGGLCWLFTY